MIRHFLFALVGITLSTFVPLAMALMAHNIYRDCRDKIKAGITFDPSTHIATADGYVMVFVLALGAVGWLWLATYIIPFVLR